MPQIKEWETALCKGILSHDAQILGIQVLTDDTTKMDTKTNTSCKPNSASLPNNLDLLVCYFAHKNNLKLTTFKG